MTIRSMFRPTLACALYTIIAACGGTSNKSNSSTPTSIENRVAATQDEANAKRAEAGEQLGEAAGDAARTTLTLSIPKTPQAPPDGLLGAVVLVHPHRDITAAVTYGNTVMPNILEMFGLDTTERVLERLFGMDAIRGLDPNKPIRALLMDPKRFTSPWLIVGSPKSAQALDDARAGANPPVVYEHGDHVAIGAQDTLKGAGVYALGTWVHTALPTESTFSLFTNALMDRFQAEFDMILGMLSNQAAHNPDMTNAVQFFRGFAGLMRQSDRLEFGLSIKNATADVRMELIPVSGSPFAGMLGNERKANFSLVPHLPPSPMVFAGRSLSPELSEALTGFARGQRVPFMDAAVQAKMDAASDELRDSMTGEFAGTMGISKQNGSWLAGLWETNTPKRADRAMTTLINDVTLVVLKRLLPTLSPRKKTFTHRKTRMTELSFPMPKDIPTEIRSLVDMYVGKSGIQLATGVLPKHVLVMWGGDVRTRSKRVIDVVAGRKRPARPDPALSGLLRDAERRGETVMFALDVQTVLADLELAPGPAGGGDWLGFGVSFADRTVRTRFTLPAASLRALAGVSMP